MPVGGAPSRSGFLATPTDASPKPTFSEHTPHPGRRDAACPPESGKRSSALRSSKVRKALEDDYEKRTYLRNLNRSGLGSAAAKLPPHESAW
jgi:hypothetical protein